MNITIRKKEIILLFFLLAVTAIIYAPASKNKFNNWDDFSYITHNPNIELTKENVNKSFTAGEPHGMYAPLTALSLSVTNHFYQLKPKPYILTNLVFHLCNVLLLFVFLSMISSRPFVPVLVAALFAIHPANAEVVAYAAGRRDVLYVFFYLLCMICYTRSVLGKKNKPSLLFYILSVVFAILSLLSKGQAVTITAILLIIDLFLGKKINDKSIWINKLPFLLPTIFVTYKIFHAPLHAVGSFPAMSFLEHINIDVVTPFQHVIYACTMFAQYVIKSIIPYHLSLIHSYPTENGYYAIPNIYYFYTLLFVCFAYFFIRLTIKIFSKSTIQKGVNRDKVTNSLVWFGVMFFSINMVMLLQIIRNSYSIMNDHYMYFASIGVLFVVSEITIKQLQKKHRTILVIGLVFYFMFLSYLTTERVGVFKNAITVWSDVIKKYPEEYTAYYNRGLEYNEQENYDKALIDFNMTVRLNPGYAKARMYRAIIIDRRGNHLEALNDLNIAISLDSTHALFFLNRGCVLQNLGKFSESINDLNKAISLKPSYDLAFINRAMDKVALKDYPGAIVDCDSAIAIKQHPRYYHIRAVSKKMLGNYDRAIVDLNESILLNNNFIPAYIERAYNYFYLKEYDKAVADCEQVLRMEPGNQQANQLLKNMGYAMNK